MIYEHQKRAIEYIVEKFRADPDALAFLISGSISHGYNSETSDVDFNVVVPESVYAEKKARNALT